MITKIKVKDRNNPEKEIVLDRYLINKDSEPVAIIFGKFSPWTGGDLEHGHGRLIKLVKQNGVNKFYVVSPKRDENVTGKNSPNVFSPEARKQIIEHSLKNIPGFLGVIQSDSNNLMGVIKHMIHQVDRPIFVVGPDRERLTQTNFVDFAAPVSNEKDANFGKPEYLILKGERETSGTKVRESLANDDFETFHKLTNHSEQMFRFMKNLMNQKNESFSSFYTTIFEGGNLRIGNNKANKIDLASNEHDDVEALKNRIKDCLTSFVSSFPNSDFWKEYVNLIQKNEIFSGSSKHFFEKTVAEFSKVKKLVGDIDVQFPIDYEEDLDKFIKSNVGRQFGDMILLGQGGKSPIQINTLFTDNLTGLNIQIDFEPTDFHDKIPSEFSKFSRSSDWSDLKENIKGVFHKYLLRALVGSTKINNIFVVTSYNKLAEKWRVSKKDYEGTNLQGFSVDKGVRVKYERAKNKEGKEFFVDRDGNEFLTQEAGTKPAYVETDTKTYDYIKNVGEIATICFGRQLDKNELSLFASFVGCLKLIEKYVENKEDAFSGFFELLFGKSAQEIEQGEFVGGINNTDFDVKFAAYSKMRNVSDMNQLPGNEIERIREYYEELKRKK